MEHVVVVEAVEERELLRAMGRIVGAIDVEHDALRSWIEGIDVVLLESSPQTIQLAPAHAILEPTQRGLRRERLLRGT